METFITNDQLLQLFQHTFGIKVEIVEQKIVNQNHDYLVLLVELQNPLLRIVVKLAGPESPMASYYDRTAMLHRLVGTHTTIPMPEILAVNMSYETWPWRYLIKTYIPGQEWAVVRQQMDRDELSRAYHQIASAVAQLHMIQFPVFGELANDGSVLNNGQFLAAFSKRAQLSIQSAQLRDLFFFVLNKHTSLFTDIHQACLCHEDLHQHNILFQYLQGKWHLATILDFDKTWAGDHEIDLARMEFWRGMTSDEFWRVYKSVHPIQPDYEQRRLIYQLLWCFEYARSTPEHLADTRRLCAHFGIECPERFD
jgi:aminoglycoside phosphotransferase (APT) family kinase protein